MPIVEITDPADPRLDVYRQLNRANLTRTSGRFIAESRLLVERLLASRHKVESILAADRFRDELIGWVPATVPIYLLPQPWISEVIGFEFHRGMLACGYRPLNPTLEQLLEPVGDSPAIVVVCPHLVDPTNLAGVIRNCCALGAAALILGPHCADAFSRRVVRVSMGTVLELPLRIADDIAVELTSLHAKFGFERAATVLDADAIPLSLARCPRRLALLFGSEGHGLEPATIRQCDWCVTLPMQRQTDSLNLATSTGVFMYHFTNVAPFVTPSTSTL